LGVVQRKKINVGYNWAEEPHPFAFLAKCSCRIVVLNLMMVFPCDIPKLNFSGGIFLSTFQLLNLNECQYRKT